MLLVDRVHDLIKRKATGTPVELAERLGLNERDWYRLLYDMRKMGFPIVYSSQRRSYYYEGEVIFMFKVCALNEEEQVGRKGGQNFSYLDTYLFFTDKSCQWAGLHLPSIAGSIEGDAENPARKGDWKESRLKFKFLKNEKGFFQAI